MPASIPIASVVLEAGLYTCDASLVEATSWSRSDATFTADSLAVGRPPVETCTAAAFLRLNTRPLADGLTQIRAEARLDRPIKAIKFTLDLPYMKMLAPECIDLEQAQWRQWDFPRDWRAGFAVWQDGQRYFTVSTKESPWRFKRLRALRTGERMRLEIIQDASVRERSMSFQSSEWHIGYRDSIDGLLDEHAAFVRQAFGAQRFAARPDVPEWLRNVGLIVNLHGADWSGNVHLDYAGMSRAARTLADLFPPQQTILYLIGWDGRYMRRYPEYQPCDTLGGVEAFKSFCDDARQSGFHVMPHLNAMAANMCHPLYLQHLKDYVLRDANGLPQYCRKIDWDHDGLGDAAHAYISLVPPAMREILCDTIDRLVNDFSFDAIFLDETCNVFYNDPAWDQVDGVRRLVRDIRTRHPSLLIAGEEWNEMLLGLTPLVQVWEETADGRKGFGREKSPLMRQWASQFIRACGYLALASPDGRTGVHEWPDSAWVDERKNEAFYIPTLSLTADTLDSALDGVRATIERAEDYMRRFTNR